MKAYKAKPGEQYLLKKQHIPSTRAAIGNLREKTPTFG